ncbi:MAG: iron chelate uptake ABC transporter family permease subunit [Anaerolineae bacterium]
MSSLSYRPIPNPQQYVQETQRTRINLGLRPFMLVILLGLLLAIFLLSVSVGSVSIPFDQVITILLGGEGERASWEQIIFNFRLPKATTALLAGSALGVSGLMMQTFFRNPLAGPFVLGISSGASLGVALVVLASGSVGGALMAGFGLSGDLLLAGASALGAGLTMLIVLLVAHRVQDSMTLLILGLMIGQFVTAFVSLLLYFAVPERIQAYINWTFGTFSGVTWNQMPILAGATFIGLVMALLLIKSLNALLLGEHYARSLGMNVQHTRLLIVSATALLAGVVTAFCGPIGFLGIAVPHLCRSLFNTSDHRVLVPGTMLMGAIVSIVASLIAEVPGHSLVLPLNAVTALIGAPVVILVVLRQRNVRQSFAS